jgi:hypothetical protein
VLAAAALLGCAREARGGDAPVAVPAAKQAPAAVVVAAVTRVAVEHAARSAETRLTGDALGDLYVQRAATAAAGDVRAFTTGLARALDPTDALGKFPLTARAVRDLESADETKARLAALGTPTLRGRNDRLLHFAVSAALASLVGEGAAAMAGIAKELSDMKGASGFSIGDLLADTAGIVFARRLAAGEPAKNLAWVASAFTGAAVVPDDAGLPDALTATEFEKAYGSVTDPRFVRAREGIAARVEALPYLRPVAVPSAGTAPEAPPIPGRDPRPTK